MLELSISVDAENCDIAKFVYQFFKSKTTELDLIVTCYEEYGKVFVMIACDEKFQNDVKTSVEKCVTKVVCDFYKERFLSENLMLPMCESVDKIALKKALINFDKETDVFFVHKNLNITKNIFLDSFFAFRLKVLKDKWGELVSLANDNKDFLTSKDAFYDLLHFLIDNLESVEDEIDVFEREAGYDIHTKKSANEKYLKDLSQETLIAKLIDFCPQKINFFYKKDDVAVNLLNQIFEKRVNICYGSAGNIEKFANFK